MARREIAVDPAFRMRGHGRAMFSQLSSLRAVDIPFMARGVERAEFDEHVTDPHFLPVWTRLAPTGDWFHVVEVDEADSAVATHHG